MKAKAAERIVYENKTLKYRGPLLVLYMYIDFFWKRVYVLTLASVMMIMMMMAVQ